MTQKSHSTFIILTSLFLSTQAFARLDGSIPHIECRTSIAAALEIEVDEVEARVGLETLEKFAGPGGVCENYDCTPQNNPFGGPTVLNLEGCQSVINEALSESSSNEQMVCTTTYSFNDDYSQVIVNTDSNQVSEPFRQFKAHTDDGFLTTLIAFRQIEQDHLSDFFQQNSEVNRSAAQASSGPTDGLPPERLRRDEGYLAMTNSQLELLKSGLTNTRNYLAQYEGDEGLDPEVQEWVKKVIAFNTDFSNYLETAGNRLRKDKYEELKAYLQEEAGSWSYEMSSPQRGSAFEQVPGDQLLSPCGSYEKKTCPLRNDCNQFDIASNNPVSQSLCQGLTDAPVTPDLPNRTCRSHQIEVRTGVNNAWQLNAPAESSEAQSR